MTAHSALAQLRKDVGNLCYCPDCKREVVPPITVPRSLTKWRRQSCNASRFEHDVAAGTVILQLDGFDGRCVYKADSLTIFEVSVGSHGLRTGRALQAALLAAAQLGYLSLSD